MITLIDARERDVYDGLEPVDYAAPLPGEGLSASDLCRTRLLELEGALGADAVALICATSKLKRGGGPFASIVDARGLCVYGFFKGSVAGERELWITSYGESQPARYLGWILSVWRVETGADGTD